MAIGNIRSSRHQCIFVGLSHFCSSLLVSFRWKLLNACLHASYTASVDSSKIGGKAAVDPLYRVSGDVARIDFLACVKVARTLQQVGGLDVFRKLFNGYALPFLAVVLEEDIGRHWTAKLVVGGTGIRYRRQVQLGTFDAKRQRYQMRSAFPRYARP